MTKAEAKTGILKCMSALPKFPPDATRDFYGRQLEVAFRHSRPFYVSRGTVADQVMATRALASILDECAPGSLEAARRIGELAVVSLNRAAMAVRSAAGELDASSQPGEWWRDLLNYERSCFLQLATTAEAPPANRPRRALSALCMTFAWRIPTVVERLARGEPVTADERQAITLLFARRQGEACVVEIGASVERVFRATNGLRIEDQIALAGGVSREEADGLLEALAGIGAILPAMTADQMTRALLARERA